jgi:RNA-binding protein YhbY
MISPTTKTFRKTSTTLLCITIFALSTFIVPSTWGFVILPSTSTTTSSFCRPTNIVTNNNNNNNINSPSIVCRQLSSTMTQTTAADGELQEDEDDEDVDIEFLFEEPPKEEIPYDDLKVTEKVWRYAKKPLLRIGAKGATHSHGNSLRQLLDDHAVVKVKVNTRKFGTLQNAFETLKNLAVENGASPNIELIQMRENDKTILFGLPGTIEKMNDGSFPPPPLASETESTETSSP